MRRSILFIALSAIPLGAAAPAFADGLRIRDAAARVVVIPENRRDVAVSIAPGDPRLPQLRTHMEGGDLVVEGGLERRIGECTSGGWWSRRGDNGVPAARRVVIRGIGPIAYEHLPVITARVPMTAQVAAGGAVWGDVGATESLRLQSAGCGDWKVGDVQGPLDVDTSGSGDVSGRNAGGVHAHISGSGDLGVADVGRDVDLAIAGSGDVRLGRVAGRLRAKVAGSGDVSVARVDGPVDASIHGSGNVKVNDGSSPTVAVSVAGSGDFVFRGVAGTLNAQVAGSGDVTVARVTGPVSKAVAGSGEIHIGR